MKPTHVIQAAFTLRDLLAEAGLGLKLVVGSDASLDRPISGANYVDGDHPARRLDRDSVMLTTGLLLPSDLQGQRSLIAELDDAGVAAIGIGLDAAHRHVPDGLIDAATKRKFPVFTIPHRTAFQDILSVVYGATLSSEIRASSRLVAMQTFLTDSLGDESPRSTVVQRLAVLIGARVGLVLAGGEVIVSAGSVPGRAIAEQIRERSTAIVSFETEKTHGLAVALGDAVAPPQWLVVASPLERPLHPLARRAAMVTVPLLVAMDRLDATQRVHDAAMRRATIERLLDVEDRYEASAAATVAAASGVEIARGVMVMAAIDPLKADLERTLEPFVVKMESARIPFIGAVRDDQLVGIVDAGAVSDELIRDSLLQINPMLDVGVGRAVDEPGDVRLSYADAVVALQAVPAGSRTKGAIIHYDDLDLATMLVHELPPERLGPRVDLWLEPVLNEGPLLETLVCYLRHDLDVGRTARALHLHPNSIRYRLARVEELLGARIRSPSTMLALVIALYTKQLITDLGTPLGVERAGMASPRESRSSPPNTATSRRRPSTPSR